MKTDVKTELLQEAVLLAGKTGHVVIATVNGEGIPHIAASKKLSLDSKNKVVLTEWFCPGTMENLTGRNSRLAIAVWDSRKDTGYQLIGRAMKEEDLAYLDGYASDLEKKHDVPQIQRKITVEVEKILDFKLKPHTDIERS
ncbi:MAG TPA: pyridoxamine 5'-phosphate oxidase family protein [Syntrophales bacterium]|nr:pyridoxamine 5'-phosphate oxidase family protein [Syntrophales bacterium]